MQKKHLLTLSLLVIATTHAHARPNGTLVTDKSVMPQQTAVLSEQAQHALIKEIHANIAARKTALEKLETVAPTLHNCSKECTKKRALEHDSLERKADELYAKICQQVAIARNHGLDVSKFKAYYNPRS